jgi:hypothetical protein
MKLLKYMFKKLDGGVDWIDLAQDRDTWQVDVKTAQKLRIPQNEGTF